MNNLIKVSKGSQLKECDYCWQMNDSFPGVVNTIVLKGISQYAKYDIVRMIKLGRIYLRKEDL